MSGCGFEEDLVALQDGELPAPRAEAVKAHLPGCASCTSLQGRLGRLSGAVAALSSAPSPVPSHALRARVLAEVARPPSSPLATAWARLREWPRPWLLVPALAGLGAVAWVAAGPLRTAPAADAPLPEWAAEAPEEPAVLEAALVLDELDELELGALETPEDLEVVSALDELEREGRP